jgi:predicted RNA methylase
MQSCAARLRAGKNVSDEEFDEVYFGRIKAVSFRHWTPVAVARRAALLLTGMGARRVLDVGSGAGKFCIVGALSTDAKFSGIEQRKNLVDAAEDAAARMGASRASFIHGNFVNFDWLPFDGIYFYNPFQEQIEEYDPVPIDGALDPSTPLHNTYVACATSMLIRAPVGTAVVTYNGFGGPMPRQYRHVSSETLNNAELALWVRTGTPKTLKRRTSPEDKTQPIEVGR